MPCHRTCVRTEGRLVLARVYSNPGIHHARAEILHGYVVMWSQLASGPAWPSP